MRIGNNFLGLNISAEGLSTQRKRMNLISENIANINTTKTEDGTPYKRKYLVIHSNETNLQKPQEFASNIKLKTSNGAHIKFADQLNKGIEEANKSLNDDVVRDDKVGDILFMPDHPDADEKGNVVMPNVNVVTEMIDMITASRTYEANVTAIGAAKQMAKDSMEL